MMKNYISSALADAQKLLDSIVKDEQLLSLIEASTQTMVKTIREKGKILSCGNGGSMCDSMHFAEELTGRYRKDRPALAALSMADPSHLTCVGNDYGFDQIFSRYVEAWGREGDCLLSISTSGNSPNCINAVQAAKERGMKTIALLGKDGGKLRDMVDFPLIVPHSTTDRIQEIHIKIIHIMIEGIERALFPLNYT